MHPRERPVSRTGSGVGTSRPTPPAKLQGARRSLRGPAPGRHQGTLRYTEQKSARSGLHGTDSEVGMIWVTRNRLGSRHDLVGNDPRTAPSRLRGRTHSLMP